MLTDGAMIKGESGRKFYFGENVRARVNTSLESMALIQREEAETNSEFAWADRSVNKGAK